MTLAVVTRSAEETAALAQRVGALLRAGDVVVLAGQLGIGKTVFAKGIARALGITEPVVSPSFTIVRQYDGGTLPLVHVDVYRLDHLQELHDIGFDDLVGGDAVTIVEWGDRVGSILPADRLEVSMLADATDDDTRVVQFDANGLMWSDRRDALAAAVGGDA
ncbi:MAG: tRNA (adenosine(37)-N6)-threonylcarbamoyltransferase complex ATPase subunit type 1 TsaE [Acidimicrobiia bacterium]